MLENISIFYSYSHKDERLRKKLETHLALLQQEGLISGWHDRNISAGTEWEHEIDTHLNSAQIILLLVSADFLASRYCYSIEMKRAMERHDTGVVRVIPIILREVDWKGAPFSKLQALPTEARPVTGRGWHNQEEAFANIARGIRKAVEELRANFQGEAPKSIPIDNALLAVLNIHKDSHRQKNVPFFTPSLLLALLDIPNSIAQRAFEALKPGLATELQSRLKSYVLAAPESNTGSSFSDFQWEERADVHLAQQWALKEGSAAVTGHHLLLGILETKSNTQQGLKNMLGENDFRRLLQIVKDMPAVVPYNDSTPGIHDFFQ